MGTRSPPQYDPQSCKDPAGGAPWSRGSKAQEEEIPIKANLRLTLIAAALTLLLTIAFVVPAFGVPDPLQLADRALDRAKKATKSAKKARKSARRAKKTADTALNRANLAWTGTLAGPAVSYRTEKVLVAPLKFGDLTLRCPDGYRVTGSSISPGAVIPVSEAVAPNFVIFSGYNASATPYSYYAQLQCVQSVRVSFAGAAAVQRRVEEAKRAFLAGRGSTAN